MRTIVINFLNANMSQQFDIAFESHDILRTIGQHVRQMLREDMPSYFVMATLSQVRRGSFSSTSPRLTLKSSDPMSIPSTSHHKSTPSSSTSPRSVMFHFTPPSSPLSISPIISPRDSPPATPRTDPDVDLGVLGYEYYFLSISPRSRIFTWLA